MIATLAGFFALVIGTALYMHKQDQKYDELLEKYHSVLAEKEDKDNA
jgi:menaquinone-dependent protoporphyrinogen IX oxidase